MASSSTRSQRRLLFVFLILSLAAHFLLIAAIVVPPYVRKIREAQVAAEAREQARQRAEQRKQEAAKAAEQEKKQAAIKAVEEARQQVAAELREEFKAVVGEQIKGPDADQLWDQILAQLTAGLDDYSREAANENAPDAEIRQGMMDLQGKMLEELAARLRERSSRELADAFVARVQNDVAPKLIDYHRKQLQTKIGVALRDAGAKIVQEDAAEVRGKRAAVVQALADAERQARSAATDLLAAKRRLVAAINAADVLRKNGKTDGADKKLEDAVHLEQAGVERAGKAIDAAGQRLRDAAEKADGLADDTTRAVRTAGAGIDDAVAKSGKAKADAQQGKVPELTVSAGDAAAAAGKLADAAHVAREAAAREHGDVTVDARVALKRARDDDLKKLIEDSFWRHYANRSAPRLGDKLTDAFRKTLEQGGIQDKAVVADVDKRVKAALLDGVRDKIKAGQAGTDALTHGQHLDDVADDAPHGPPTTGPADHHGHGNHDGGADAIAQGPATQPGGAENAHHGKSARQEAIAERIGKTARDLVHSNIDGEGDDDAGDATALDAARGRVGARKEKWNGEVDESGLAGLAARVGRLAGNVKSGRTDLADAAQAGGGAGSPGAGAAGGAGAGVAHVSEFDHYHGPLLRNHLRYTNEAEYAAITAGIHERDRLAAQGHATTRRSAEGEIAAAAQRENSSVVQPAVVLVPPTPKSDPIGQAAKHDPFKPGFKNIRFAAIPYREKPVTIDGDLSEWKDVPELPLVPALYQHALKPELKKFPQAVKVQWDNTGFYLAYDVKDADDKISRANPGNFWEADGIEFWVDTLNTKEKHRTQCTHQFWAWAEPGLKDPTRVGGEARSWPGEDEYLGLGSDVIKTASKRTAGGWTIEVFIPASRFRMLDLQPGRILGMNFSICTGTDLYYYWAGTTEVATARRPDTWGDALLAGSAGRLECVDKLTSELKPPEVSKALSALRIGQPLRVRVSDADMNLSNTARDRVAVTVSTRRGARRTLILEETGDATGVFEGVLQTGLDTGDAPSAVLPLLDGDSVDLTYIDQCRPDGARDVPVKLTLPTAAAITNLPSQ